MTRSQQWGRSRGFTLFTVVLAVMLVTSPFVGITRASPALAPSPTPEIGPSPDSAAAAPGSECVEKAQGRAYPVFIDITCFTTGSSEMNLQTAGPEPVIFTMRHGWVYIIHIQVPEDADSGSVFWNSSTTFVSYGSTSQRWPPHFGKKYQRFRDEVAIWAGDALSARVPREIGDEEIKGVPISRGATTTIWPKSSYEKKLDFAPGVYKIEMWAAPPSQAGELRISEQLASRTDSYDEYLGLVGDTFRRSKKEHSTVILEVGGCRAEFSARERLNNLDRRKLEATRDFFKAYRNFNHNQREATVGAFLLGSMPFLPPTPSSKTKIKSWENKSIGEKIGLPGIEAIIKSYKLSDRLNAAIRRLKKIERQRKRVKHRINVCRGGGYVIPDSYDPLSRQDILEAKYNADTVKDES